MNQLSIHFSLLFSSLSVFREKIKLRLQEMSEVTSENCYLQLSLIFHIFRVSVTILFYKRGDNAS